MMHRAGVAAGSVSSVQIIIIVIAVILTIGVFTCVVSHYKMGARSWSERWNRSVAQQAPHQVHHHVHHHHHHLENNPSTVLYVSPVTQDRLAHEVALFRERQIRMQSVQNDIELDLPPSIGLPDGEEYPYDSLHHLSLRNAEQESEIYRECIRPPPNRTIFEGESPPPYRSSSVGTLHRHHHHHHHHHAGSGGGGGGGAHSRTEPLVDFDGSPLVITPRCHSASSANSGGGGSSSGASSGRSTPLSQLRIARLMTRKTSTASSNVADGGSSSTCSGCLGNGAGSAANVMTTAASISNHSLRSPSSPLPSLVDVHPGGVPTVVAARLAPSSSSRPLSSSSSASSVSSRDSSCFGGGAASGSGAGGVRGTVGNCKGGGGIGGSKGV